MSVSVKSFKLGDHQVTIETGLVARQATGAVTVDVDGTVVLATAVAKTQVSEGQDFFPLTVNYQERMYAAGRIPGGFFKREGRPSEQETLTARLIDRPLRPSFPDGFLNEVQVTLTVMSLNPEVPADIPAMIGASAALAVSGVPFNGPIAGIRVAYIDEQFVINPTQSQMEKSLLDLVVAGNETSVLMVESEAQELSERVMLEAVMAGHEGMQPAIQAIQALADEAGKPRWDWAPAAKPENLAELLAKDFEAKVQAAFAETQKTVRNEQLNVLRGAAVEALATEASGFTEAQVSDAFHSLEKAIVRGQILRGERRIDGRDTETVRPISVQTGILPRTHGSALFTRGETQAIVVATLGSGRDAQIIDAVSGETKDNFMLHYNFPPYCVGETGMMGSPKRREIGHGRLARRAVQGVLPDEKVFPYVTRVVSEITESNGSSSMASVCGASLALMDAGVPLKAPVAGVAMGLIKDGNKFAILTDILGDEDHLGDMDFKVAGSERGVTALQMDIKIDGITRDIMAVALDQAHRGRVHILGIMNEALPAPKRELSEFAPRVLDFMINPDKIRDVIGKGGATIKALTEETGANIEITDEGRVIVVASSQSQGEAVQQRIEKLVEEAEVGKIYEGKVLRVVDFGAFVNILPGKDGLVHISQIREERVENVSDFIEEGQTLRVKVLEIDRQGRIKLTMRGLDDSNDAEAAPEAVEAQAEETSQPSEPTPAADTADENAS